MPRISGIQVPLFKLFSCTAAILAATIALGADVRESTPDNSIDWSKARQFWSFQLPVAQSRPQVRQADWPRQSLDYFILARLEQRVVSPSLQADRHVLVRRVTFDLTGLPPTPREVEAFVSDGREDA